LTQAARRYGDVVQLRFGQRLVLLVSHPDLIEQVLQAQHRYYAKGFFYRILTPLLGTGLLTSEGDFWLRQRRLAQPAFHRARIAAYATTMLEYADAMLAEWRDGEVRDIYEDMTRLTLRVVGKTLFDTDLSREATDVGDALGNALRELNLQISGPEVMLPAWVPTPSRMRLRRAVRRLDRLVLRLIAERRASGVDRGDLLSALLQAQDEDGSRMSDRQLRDEAMTIVLAGHETTAIALSWTWLLLSEHPEVAERVREEVRRVTGERPLTVDSVPQLTFADAVLKEAMRLYPPIVGIGRENLVEVELGGYRLPPGTNIFINLWVVQRDPRFFARPEVFDPDRWLDGRTRDLPHYAYFPFGGGPRLCIGQPFAMMEATLVLARVISQWRLELEPSQRVELAPALTLRPKHGVMMTPRRVATDASRPSLTG
jgi:cytochrome P450